jgi:ubiquitin carboxyl-terminal hydrolase L3
MFKCVCYCSIDLSEGHLKKFLDATKDLSADARAVKLEIDEGLSTAHEQSAQEGQTEAPNRDEKVDLHFVALVEKEGCLYELGKLSCTCCCYLHSFL